MDNQQASLCKYYKQGIWICEDGSVYGTKAKILSAPTNSGYLRLTTDELLHRLVYKLFKGEIPKKYTINHINGVKTDNRVCNLEAVTYRDNSRHSARVLGKLANLTTKLTELEILDIVKLLSDTEISCNDIAKQYSVSDVAISAINTGKNSSRITSTIVSSYPIRKQYIVQSKLNSKDISEIRQMLNETKISMAIIAKKFNVSQQFISSINLGLRHKESFRDYPIRSRG